MFAGVTVPGNIKPKGVDRLNTGVSGFEVSDPNASDASKLLITKRNEATLNFRLSELGKRTEPWFTGLRTPFLSQTDKKGLELKDRAGEWYQSDKANKYFRQNPELLVVAERDPVGFYEAIVQAGKKSRSVPAPTPTPAGAGMDQRALPKEFPDGRPAPTGKMDGRFPIDYRDPLYDYVEQRAAERVGVPVELLRAVRLAGERSNANQVSSAGARTPYQFTPGTKELFRDKYGVNAWASPDEAALAAAYHLKESLDRGATPEIALREYHGGPTRAKWGEENRKYAQRTMAFLGGAPTGEGQQAGTATSTPVPQLKSSDFYLANKDAVGYDMAMALRNRQEIQRIADIYQRNGMAEQYLGLRFKLLEMDSNLLSLQGIQGIQEFSVLRDPTRLEAVYSQYLGSPVRFQPRTDGTYNVTAGGRVLQSGVSQGDLITAVRTGIDKQYATDRSKISSEISIKGYESQLKREEEAVKQELLAARDVINARTAAAREQALQQLKQSGSKLVNINGIGYLQKGDAIYQISPGGEPVPGLENVPSASSMQRVQGPGTSG
jgi:hypothetical protein